MIWDILASLLLVAVMVVSSSVALNIFEKIVHEIKISKLLLATILVGFSTSLPELFVGIESALRGQGQLALGDLIGANLANMSWIIGGAALIAGSIPIVGEYVKKDLWVTLVAAMIPFVLLSDGVLGRLDGIILIIFYFIYIQDLIKNGHPLRHLHMANERKPVHHRLKTEVHWVEELAKLVLALGILAGSSWLLINLAVVMAEILRVSYFWIGLLLIAVGTTLPELILSITASKRKEVSLVLGNVFGSVVVNSTLILGITALISPLVYEESLSKGVSGLFLILILGLFWIFTKSKHKLEKWEGAVLVGLYAMFVGIQMLIA